MADDEFAIIERYFSRIGWQSEEAVVLGPGDDCAILSVPNDHELCVSTDTLVSGVHFPADSTGRIVAHRSLTAAVSDLAAMGAKPHAVTLALTMPMIDHEWLAELSAGLSDLSIAIRLPLVGGNLSRGPLSLSLTVMGVVPTGLALRRSGARPGDGIYVTGFPGEAGAGLLLLGQEGKIPRRLIHAYCYPEPRVEAGMALRGIASAAIDVSDGLLADLTHLTTSSEVGAVICLDDIPLSPDLRAQFARNDALSLALTAGDDYELCFTAPEAHHEAICTTGESSGLPMTRIGRITGGSGFQLTGSGVDELKIDGTGYQHF